MHLSLNRKHVASLALALSLTVGGASAIAQDATPAADVDVVCAAGEVTPVASPADIAATPSVDPAEGTVVEDQAVIDSATAAVTECNPDAQDLTVESVMQIDETTYEVEYQYRSDHQVLRVLEMYAVDGSTWTAGERSDGVPTTDQDTTTASVKVAADGTLELSPASFPVAGALRFNVTNAGEAPVTVAVMSGAAEDFDATSLVGTSLDELPSDLTYEGDFDAAPGGQIGQMMFEDIGEGTIVVAVLDADGNIVSAGTVTATPPTDTGL